MEEDTMGKGEMEKANKTTDKIGRGKRSYC